MIGNDVVDIEAARRESNWQRKGFLEKIYSFEEQNLIYSHPNQELMVWLLWSMKEAAYKILNRQSGIRAYIPHKLLCSEIVFKADSFTGIVSYGAVIYLTRTTIKNNILHTIATVDKHHFKKIKQINPANIIKGSNSIPLVYNAFNQLRPASVSHHGRAYKAIAIL